ncbi:MAG TPA: hypothetical protein VMU32_12910 [Solirubrobacteraceae bacterium]|nr:hypothetical protein [Solirubrobacteraceae bacterium]
MPSTATPMSRLAAPLPPSRPGARRRAALRLALPVLVLLLLALLVAGCGGSSPSSGVAHIGNASATTPTSGGSSGGAPEGEAPSAATQEKMVKFAQCMRTHGEPEFPEPDEGRIVVHNRNGHGPNPESAQFQAAEKACKQYAPVRQAPSPEQQAKIREQALKFSECMRQHGVPNFPTPEFSHGGAAVRMKVKAGSSTGIEPNSPQFQAAQKDCQADSPLKGAKGGVAIGPPGGPKGAGVQSSSSVGGP